MPRVPLRLLSLSCKFCAELYVSCNKKIESKSCRVYKLCRYRQYSLRDATAADVSTINYALSYVLNYMHVYRVGGTTGD
jgi:hypothetical protein